MINLPWILAHFIGDFVIQNDWMAINKKKSTFVCSVHVITYMLPFLLVSLTPLQFLLIGVQHFIQDRSNFIKWYCKVTNKFQDEKGLHLPWGHFIVDNVFHVIWMYFVINYL